MAQIDPEQEARRLRYRGALADLLPPGLIWNRDPSSRLMAFLEGLGSEFGHVERRSLELLEEVDPHRTVEMLPDWERIVGLPDACVSIEETVQDRRQAVLVKLAAVGGQSRQFYIDLAAEYGFTITITEFTSFVAGPAYGDDRSKAGDALTNAKAQPAAGAGWQDTWQVNAPLETIREFKAGEGQAGDPLRWWGNTLLECLISRAKPAHTHVLFSYT
jgi:uncharacterized protein YmfQ (DUF2313 family)